MKKLKTARHSLMRMNFIREQKKRLVSQQSIGFSAYSNQTASFIRSHARTREYTQGTKQAMRISDVKNAIEQST